MWKHLPKGLLLRLLAIGYATQLHFCLNRAVITGAGVDRVFRDEEGGKAGVDLSIDIVLPAP